MDIALSHIKKYFPFLPQNALLKIYKARIERLRLLRSKGIFGDVLVIIEARVRISGEYPHEILPYLPGCGRSTYAKKRRAKKLKVCHKCARWNCNTRCRSLGYLSTNREDKIQFIKDGLSKESLDNILLNLETHPCGLVQREILSLWRTFHDEWQRYSLGNLTKKDPVCQFIRKLDGKHIPNS